MDRASGACSTTPEIADETLRHNINEAHEWAANMLLLLAAGHAAVALAHQFMWRDGVLEPHVAEPRALRREASQALS